MDRGPLRTVAGRGDRRNPRAPHACDRVSAGQGRAAGEHRLHRARHSRPVSWPALPTLQPAGPGQGSRLPDLCSLRVVEMQLSTALSWRARRRERAPSDPCIRGAALPCLPGPPRAVRVRPADDAVRCGTLGLRGAPRSRRGDARERARRLDAGTARAALAALTVYETNSVYCPRPPVGIDHVQRADPDRLCVHNRHHEPGQHGRGHDEASDVVRSSVRRPARSPSPHPAAGHQTIGCRA
jgi:hypothetical protein